MPVPLCAIPAFCVVNRQADLRLRAICVLAAYVRIVPVLSGVLDRSFSSLTYPVSFYTRIICMLVKRQKVLHNCITSLLHQGQFDALRMVLSWPEEVVT